MQERAKACTCRSDHSCLDAGTTKQLYLLPVHLYKIVDIPTETNTAMNTLAFIICSCDIPQLTIEFPIETDTHAETPAHLLPYSIPSQYLTWSC